MHLIHSGDIPQPYIKCIDGLFPGIIRIPVPRSKYLYASIASHPDIFIFSPDHNTIVASPSLYEEIAASLSRADVYVVRSQTTPCGNYPETAPLNAVRVGAYVLHNVKYTDTVIRDIVRKAGLELINVNQGYTRCSVIPVSHNALITCDRGIAKTAKGIGLDVKLVSSGNVLLPGEEYGFIGGTAGVTPDGKVVFLGDIRRHPDYAEMDSFFNEHRVEYAYLAELPLFDAGSLIFIK